MPAPAGAAPDPVALLRSPSYIGLLVFGAITGVPVAVVTYFFLQAVAETQNYVFTTLPDDLGFGDQPGWWPILPLALSGLLVALTIRYLPGEAGHKPAEGFKAGGAVPPIELPGIALAAFFTLSLGVVLGPEAPLIAIGSGMGVLAVRLIKRDAPAMATMVIGGAGKLRSDRRPARLPARGRIPVDGGGGTRRCDDGRRPRARVCSPPASDR